MLEAVKTIGRHGCTCTFGFDAHWQDMRRVADFEHYRFSINQAILAGEPRSYALVRSMCVLGATINHLYAQTENGPLVSLADHDCVNDSINKYTHGRPLPTAGRRLANHRRRKNQLPTRAAPCAGACSRCMTHNRHAQSQFRTARPNTSADWLQPLLQNDLTWQALTDR